MYIMYITFSYKQKKEFTNKKLQHWVRQGTHVAISAAFFTRITTFLSRFSIFCWPTGQLVILACKDHQLALLGQPDIYCWPDRASKRLKTLTKKQQSWQKTLWKLLHVSPVLGESHAENNYAQNYINIYLVKAHFC